MQDMCLLSFCVADTENQKLGSNHVLTQEPNNMLPGRTEVRKKHQQDRHLSLGRKEMPRKKQMGQLNSINTNL